MKEYEKNEIVYEEGDMPEYIYIVKNGEFLVKSILLLNLYLDNSENIIE